MSKKKSEKEAKEKKQSEKKSPAKSKKASVASEETVVLEPKKEKAKASKPKAAPVVKKKPVSISNEDIALRAYFIAERRHKMGWPGDSTSDWVEAERQLRAEAARKK